MLKKRDETKMLFFLLFTIVTSTYVIKNDYDGPHYGNSLTIAFARGPVKRVIGVMWCSELYAPVMGEVERDINDCKAHNLIRATLHPVVALDKTFLTIDPTSVGGFWQHRQADIVIHAELEDGTMLEQVLRMYPFTGQAAPVEVAAAAEEKAKPLPAPAPVFTTVPTLSPFQSTMRPITLILLGIGGLCVFAATIFLVIYDRRRGTKVALVSDPYEFEMIDLQQKRQQEDINTLMALGTGANGAFKQNL